MRFAHQACSALPSTTLLSSLLALRFPGSGLRRMLLSIIHSTINEFEIQPNESLERDT
jgi:hypothetical protein